MNANDTDYKRGERFRQTLLRIGYAPAQQDTWLTYENLFNNVNAVPFLEWFCESIDSCNVLNTADINKYNLLEADGQIVEDSANVFHAKESDDDVLTEAEEVELLLTEFHEAEKIAVELLVERRKLSEHRSQLREQLQQLKDVEEESRQEYTKVQDSFTSLAAELGYAFDGAQKNVQNVGVVLGDINKIGALRFMCQIPLGLFKKLEQDFDDHVKKYIRNKFKKVDVGQPNEAWKGPSQELHDKQNDVLNSLIQCYYNSELQCHLHQAIAEGKEAVVKHVKELMEAVEACSFPTSTTDLRQRVTSAEANVSRLASNTRELRNETLPHTVLQSAKLPAATVIIQDCVLKQHRQKKEGETLRQVLTWLSDQASRDSWLWIAMEKEQQNFVFLQQGVDRFHLEMKDMVNNHTRRMAVMPSLRTDVYKKQKNVIPSHDIFLHKLHFVLSPETYRDDTPPIITHRMLQDSARELNDLKRVLELSHAKEEKCNVKKLYEMHFAAEELQNALSSKATLRPVVYPEIVSQHLSKAWTLVDVLKKRVENIEDDYARNICNASINRGQTLWVRFLRDKAATLAEVEEMEKEAQRAKIVRTGFMGTWQR